MPTFCRAANSPDGLRGSAMRSLTEVEGRSLPEAGVKVLPSSRLR
jgi:hypothetical protein